MNVLAEMMSAPETLRRRAAASQRMHADLDARIARARLAMRLEDLHASFVVGRRCDVVARELRELAADVDRLPVRLLACSQPASLQEVA